MTLFVIRKATTPIQQSKLEIDEAPTIQIRIPMSINVKSKASTTRSMTWFEEEGREIYVDLCEGDLPIEQLISDGVINAATDPDSERKIETLIAVFTPWQLIDMVNNSDDGESAVTRQFQLPTDASVEVTAYRSPANEYLEDEVKTPTWLFHQLWVETF